MAPRLWHMNADFETELASASGSSYRRTSASEALNRRLSGHLLWLARAGDALLMAEPWPDALRGEALRRGVELVSPGHVEREPARLFTPWGWTMSAVAEGERAGANVEHPSLQTVARVNSKLWSHALEIELGVAQEGAAIARDFEELEEAVARACPGSEDKWVIKSPFGFAARDRVLGRGPVMQPPQAVWCRRRFARGEKLIFQPWLEVLREYGTVLEIMPDGAVHIKGISDLQTNGAGTGTGYLLGRRPAAYRLGELERMAGVVGRRLFEEGYYGPVGIDALEHQGGLHPLLEINARYTMGFVAVAVEQAMSPTTPTFWSTRTDG